MNEIDVLLDSEGFEDLATRAELLGRIQAADRGLAERVRELRADVAGSGRAGWPGQGALGRAERRGLGCP